MPRLQLFVIAYIFWTLGAAPAVLGAPANERIRSTLTIFERSAQRGPLNIALPTMGRLQFHVAKQPSIAGSGIELYQAGRSNPRTAQLGLSADRIGDELRVRFFGRRRIGRRLRHYTLYYRLNNKAAWELQRVASLPIVLDRIPMPRALPYSPERYIEISTEADFEYYKQYREGTNLQIQALLNAAEALYREQAGLRFDLVAQHVFRQPEALTSSSAANLLIQFQKYTNRRRHLGQPDMFHLFTGKRILSGIIGLSYVAQACTPDNSFSFTSKVNENIRFLVTAHEIGHNLGASHPEDSVPRQAPSLMTGVVRPANTAFSDFSLAEISTFIDASGACLTESAGASVALNAAKSGGNVLRIANVVERGRGCNLEVYAATRRRSLITPGLRTARRARLLYEEPALEGVQEVSGTVQEQKHGRDRRVYIRTEVVCPDGEIRQSKAVEVRVRVRRGGRRAALRRVVAGFSAGV